MLENEIFSENNNVEIEVKKPVKKKRQLTEKQLENLRKGREKMKAKREEAKKKKMLKDEKVAVKENKKIVKENKAVKKKNTKLQEEALAHKEELLRRKKEREETAEKEAQQEARAEQLSRFNDMRSKWLMKTNSVEEYETVEQELGNIPEEVILNEEKLGTTLLDLVKKYKGENYE